MSGKGTQFLVSSFLFLNHSYSWFGLSYAWFAYSNAWFGPSYAWFTYSYPWFGYFNAWFDQFSSFLHHTQDQQRAMFQHWRKWAHESRLDNNKTAIAVTYHGQKVGRGVLWVIGTGLLRVIRVLWGCLRRRSSLQTEFLDKSSKNIDILPIFFEPMWSPTQTFTQYYCFLRRLLGILLESSITLPSGPNSGLCRMALYCGQIEEASRGSTQDWDQGGLIGGSLGDWLLYPVNWGVSGRLIIISRGEGVWWEYDM